MGDGHEIRRNKPPAPLAGEAGRRRRGTHRRDSDRRVWLLVRLSHRANAKARLIRAVDRDIPVLPADMVGRIRCPDFVDDLDGFHHHLRAVLVRYLEQLEVGAEPAWSDPHDKAALTEMVEHCTVSGDLRRVILRQIEHAGAELDRLGDWDQRRHELQGIGDGLSRSAVVLPDPRLLIAELLRQ